MLTFRGPSNLRRGRQYGLQINLDDIRERPVGGYAATVAACMIFHN